jgi:copper(I)-binding protein
MNHRRQPLLTGLLLALGLALMVGAACGGSGKAPQADATATPAATAIGRAAAAPTSTAEGVVRQGDLTIRDVFARVPASPDTTAVYLTVQNAGDTADALVAATTDVAGETQLHRTVMAGSTMTMQPVPRIDVPARGEVRLAPGGLHIMLLGLRQALREGDRFTIRLSFERAGTVTVTAVVRPYAQEPASRSADGTPSAPLGR